MAGHYGLDGNREGARTWRVRSELTKIGICFRESGEKPDSPRAIKDRKKTVLKQTSLLRVKI